jgi:hypothetical protein
MRVLICAEAPVEMGIFIVLQLSGAFGCLVRAPVLYRLATLAREGVGRIGRLRPAPEPEVEEMAKRLRLVV